jgi:4'-phosphopantetheinyl transferase
MVNALPPELRLETFYACWTCKEALLKATGEGIGKLTEVEIALVPGETPQVLRMPTPSGPNWNLQTFSPAPGYAGALAFQGEIEALHCWNVPPR